MNAIHFRINISAILSFVQLMGCVSADAFADTSYPLSAGTSCPQQENAVSPRGLYEDFSADALDHCKWVAVHSNWGGQIEGKDYNGGVSPENIVRRENTLVLRANGDRYTGPLRGIDSKGQPRQDGHRSGAAIMTRQRFKGGRFEAKIKIADRPGVVSAMWTYFYDWTLHGVVRNHEIDIEFPGAAEKTPPQPDNVRLAAWTGLKRGEHVAAYLQLPAITDDKFHLIRFDWVPPGPSKTGVVRFYVDGILQATTRTNVPSEPGNLWLGVWFPPLWAGQPDFAETEMLVEWVRITPLGQETAGGW